MVKNSFSFFALLGGVVILAVTYWYWSNRNSDKIQKEKWFEAITGCTEAQFRNLEKKPIVSDDSGNLFIQNIRDGHTTQAGCFQIFSLGELADHITKSITPKNKKPVLFEIITRKDMDSAQFVDIAFLQSLPKNRYCTFQVASNFNGIETIGDSSNPDKITFTSDYIYDTTQGPSASVSAGAAAIARVHAAFYDRQQPPFTWTQTSERQVQNLEKIQKFLKFQYITIKSQISLKINFLEDVSAFQ